MMFERTAALARWPPAQLTYILGPYLSGPAQMVRRTLPAEDVASYAKLKDALLDCYGVTEDLFRLRFRAVQYSRGCCPRALLAELKEAVTWWLKPTMDEGQTIVEKVVLHQAYYIMPPEAQVWVL